MDVPRAGRHIDEKIIQRPPLGLEDDLFEGGGCHRPAPDERLSFSGHVADGKPFHAVFLHGNEEGVLVVGPHHFDGYVFRAGHRGNGGAVNVRIGQPYFITFLREGDGQIHRHGALAHAAFSGSDADDVPHLPQLFQTELGRLRGGFRRILHDSIDGNLGAAGRVAVQAGLRGAHEVVLQRVRPLGKSESDVDAALRHLYVGNHSKVHDALVALGRMLHLLQPLFNLCFC